MGSRRNNKERKNTEILFGLQPLREVLRAGRREVHTVWVARKSDRELDAILKNAEKRGASVSRVTRADLDQRLGETGLNHQGVAVSVSAYPYVTIEELSAPIEGDDPTRRRLLITDQIQDVRNLGAMLRTVEAAGFTGAIIGREKSAAVTPVAVRSSAGAAEHLPVARVRNIADSLTYLKEQGFWAVGLDAEGSAIYEHDLDMDLALVVGSEGRGIRPRVRGVCDLIVSLPMRGKVGSLNASAAVAAAVFQIAR